MARKAVAASLASVVLFTVLVLADATVMSAQDNLAASAQISQAESGQAMLERSLAGSVSLQLLADVQSYLSSNAADCGSLPQYLGSISASNSTSGEESGTSYAVNANAAEVPAQAEGDNLTVIAPFAGETPGLLALKEELSIKEVGGGGSVSLSRHETHTLNVPIEVDEASSLCSSTLAFLSSALSSSPCNATLEAVAFARVLPGLVGEAAAQGFVLTAGWGGGACSPAYWFTLVEPGVQGPTGSFDWTLRGSGTAA